MKRIMTSVLCAVLVIGAAAMTMPAGAGSPADTIKERRALMKNNSGHMKAIFGYIKAGKGTAGDVARHAEALAANAGKLAGLFPAGTGMSDGAGKTRALPAVWSDKSGFEAAAAKLKSLSLALARSARSGDKKSIAMAAGGIGKQACGSCHGKFRQKRKKK